MSYNPFDKNFQEALELTDLQKLVGDSVSEGYYVEYKEEFPKNEKIAHSIASFANTYGGWYIVGVKADKVNNCATDVSGFDFIKTADPIAKIRDIIKSHINPIPLFSPRVITLSKDKAVLVVYVGENQETPFICKDGRIYRREADSSEPVSEANRYSIDKLVENGKSVNEQFIAFCKDNRCFSKLGEQQSWLNIYFYPYPRGSVSNEHITTTEKLEKIVEASKKLNSVYIFENNKLETNIPFNSFRLTNNSVVLEQHKAEFTAFNNLSIELFHDGRAKFHIPINKYRFYWSQYFEELKSTVTKEVLNTLWLSDKENNQTNISILEFFNFPELCAVVISLLTFYLERLGTRQHVGQIRFSIELENVWRLVPFLDSDQWGNHTQKYGMPIIKQNKIIFPEYNEKIFLQKDEKFYWALPVAYIGFAFGLTADLTDFAYSKYYIDFAISLLGNSENQAELE